MANLPGNKTPVVTGTMCDEHKDVEAVVRLQGETDSMGAEYHNLCKKCLDEYDENNKEPEVGMCDWCKVNDLEIYPTRDADEGTNGPVYYCCDPCIVKNEQSVE